MLAMLTIPTTKQFDFFALKIRPTTADRNKINAETRNTKFLSVVLQTALI